MSLLVKLAIGTVLFLGVGSAFVFVERLRPAPAVILPPAQSYQVEPAPVPTPTSTTPTVAKALPKSLRLNVPFIAQAPQQNWDMPYQEACEEASMLMVDAYFLGETKNPSPAVADKRILDLIAWEAEVYGAQTVDTGATTTAAIVERYFTRLEAQAIPFKSGAQIKGYLAQGYPVIIPADGKTLPNPNFRNGGPVYHMLVVKGYTEQGAWITNDPGTRKGENFLYQDRALMDSIRDWNGGNVSSAKPMILVVKPKEER